MDVELQQLIQERMQNLVKNAIEKIGEDNIPYKEFAKNTFLLSENEVSKYVFFIKTGSVRNFIYDKNGNEITTWFAFENHVTLAPMSFFMQVPTFEMIQTMETSEIYCFHWDILSQKTKTDLEINQILRYLSEMHVLLMSNRMHSLQGKFAEERYNDLIIHFPHIIKRVPLSYIASYLGVSLETLSRIRNKKSS